LPLPRNICALLLTNKLIAWISDGKLEVPTTNLPQNYYDLPTVFCTICHRT